MAKIFISSLTFTSSSHFATSLSCSFLKRRFLPKLDVCLFLVSSKQTSAFEGSVFTHSDVKPGMVVKAKVIAVDSFGAIVQLASGVKALCPLRHMSEFEITKPRKKFEVVKFLDLCGTEWSFGFFLGILIVFLV